MKPGKIIKTILLATLLFGAGSLYSQAERSNEENSKKTEVLGISGVWLKSGYFCRDGEAYDSPMREWGWGIYTFKQDGTNISGTFQNENYPWKYELKGNRDNSNLVFRVNNITPPKEGSSKTNSWIYRGEISEKGDKIKGYGSSWGSDLRRVDVKDVEKIKLSKKIR